MPILVVRLVSSEAQAVEKSGLSILCGAAAGTQSYLLAGRDLHSVLGVLVRSSNNLQPSMGDTETVTSVRGKGWVKFEEDGDDVSTSTASTRRMSATEDSPGSLEVPSCDSPLSFHLNT